jgi:hypothetical protein
MWFALMTEMRFLSTGHDVLKIESLVEEVPLILNLDEVKV